MITITVEKSLTNDYKRNLSCFSRAPGGAAYCRLTTRELISPSSCTGLPSWTQSERENVPTNSEQENQWVSQWELSIRHVTARQPMRREHGMPRTGRQEGERSESLNGLSPLLWQRREGLGRRRGVMW